MGEEEPDAGRCVEPAEPETPGGVMELFLSASKDDYSGRVQRYDFSIRPAQRVKRGRREPAFSFLHQRVLPRTVASRR